MTQVAVCCANYFQVSTFHKGGRMNMRINTKKPVSEFQIQVLFFSKKGITKSVCEYGRSSLCQALVGILKDPRVGSFRYGYLGRSFRKVV